MNWKRFQDLFTTYLFVAPAMILFAVFSLIPFFKVFQLSVFEWDGISPHMNFVGLGNFTTAIFHDVSWWISMRNAGIMDGDLLAVQKAKDAKNGQIVVARLGDEVTVKRFKREDGHVWLLPHNSAYEPIPGDDATILGKVVAVLRRV